MKEMIKITAEDIINQIGNGYFQWLSGAIFCGFSYIAVAVQIVNLSMVIQEFSDQQPIPLNADQQGLLNSILLIGMMVGSLAIGPYSDRYGRRSANILSTGIYLSFGILQVFSYSYGLMLLNRFMVGIGVGAAQASVYPIAGELSPTSHRSLLFGVLNAMYALGQMFTAPLALVTVNKLGWQVYLMLCNIPSFVAFFGFVFYVPETPQYYMSINKVEQARRVLKFMAKQNKTIVKEEMLDALTPEIVPHTQHLTTCQKAKQGIVSLLSVFMPPYVISSLCLCLIWFAAQAGWMGLSVWFPTIFSHYGAKNINQYWQATISFVVQVPGAIFSMFVIDWMGRKSLLVLICGLSGAALLFVFISPYNGILVLSSISVSMAIQVVLWSPLSLITVELYPTKVRGLVCGITLFLSFLGGFISAYFMPSLLQIDEILVIVIPLICFFVCSFLALPLQETKGQKLIESSRLKSQDSLLSKEDSQEDPLLP